MVGLAALILATQLGPFGNRMPSDPVQKREYPEVYAAAAKWGIQEYERAYGRPDTFDLYCSGFAQDDPSGVDRVREWLEGNGYPIRLNKGGAPLGSVRHEVEVMIGLTWIEGNCVLADTDLQGFIRTAPHQPLKAQAVGRTFLTIKRKHGHWTAVEQPIDIGTKKKMVEAMLRHLLLNRGFGPDHGISPITTKSIPPVYFRFEDALGLDAESRANMIKRLNSAGFPVVELDDDKSLNDL